MNICSEIYKIIEDNLDEICALKQTRKLKSDNSYVTKGDLLCEKLILDFVKDLPEEYEIISEETPISGFFFDKSKNYFILDPIDGTENFTSGLKEWGVAVSIYKQGKHFESMLALPELNEVMYSFDNNYVRFESRIYGLSSSLTKEDLLSLEDNFEYRIIGCAVYNLISVIKGAYAVFENIKGAKVWDIIGGLNIALAQGLLVTVNDIEYNGEFLQPDKKYRFKIQRR